MTHNPKADMKDTEYASGCWDIENDDEPATSMGWTPTGLRICQGSSAQPVGTPWYPTPPESYSLCQRHKKYSTRLSSMQFAWENNFLVQEQEDATACAECYSWICTFDLNVLQGLPENPRDDVCEPHHLHDDLQIHREQRRQFFSTCRSNFAVAKSRPQVFDSPCIL